MRKVQTVRVTVKGTGRVDVRVQVNPPEERLRFQQGNAKLDTAITTFSLPAGHACPGARECKSKSDRKTGGLTDGRETAFRCFSATSEARFPSVRKNRWHNLDLIRKAKTTDTITRLILRSLSSLAAYVRIHVSGDFFSQAYFDAWLEVARQRPQTLFYAYTKSLPHWVARLGEIPSNVRLTASYGGKHDSLIEQHGLRSARVVFSVQEAEQLGLLIDHDDSLAMGNGGDFALLLHGSQPQGSAAAKALSALRSEGFYGYGRSPLPMAEGG